MGTINNSRTLVLVITDIPVRALSGLAANDISVGLASGFVPIIDHILRMMLNERLDGRAGRYLSAGSNSHRPGVA